MLGGALAVGVQNYLKVAGLEQRRVLDRISLESAAVKVLGEIAAGEPHPLQPTRLPDVEINGRPITVSISLPEGKHEPSVDDPATIRDILHRAGVAESRSQSIATSLVEFLASRGVSAAQEDCLRRELTYGRAPEEFRSDSAGAQEAEAASRPNVRTVSAGDQVDLRLARALPDGEQVLWVRARFGGEGRPWSLHDYRMLKIRTPACEPQD